MPDPTDAEIQAGADAIARSWRVISPTSRRHLAKLALAAVLPGHDAAVRADERAKVADQIARDIERAADARAVVTITDRTEMARAAVWREAARIARQHAARPITDGHGAAPDAHDGTKWETCQHPVEPGSDICVRTLADPPCPACPDFGEDTP